MTEEIKKQVEFVDWMKSKKIYNPNYTAVQMRLMQMVWEESGGDKHEKMWGDLKGFVKKSYDKDSTPSAIYILRTINQIEKKHHE